MDPSARNVPSYHARPGQGSSSGRAQPARQQHILRKTAHASPRASALSAAEPSGESHRRDVRPLKTAGPARWPDPPRITARRPASRPAQIPPTSSFSFIAPLLSSQVRRPPMKSTPLPPIWADGDRRRVAQGRRKREQDDVGSRSTSRMIASTTPSVARQGKSAAGRAALNKQHNHRDAVARPTGFTVGPRLVLRGPDGQVIRGADSAKGPRKQLATLAARKTLLHDTQTGKKRAAGKAARKFRPPDVRDVVEISDSSSSEPEADDDDVAQLMAALDDLTLSTVRLKEYHRLPFLQRNVRRGFLHRCRLAGVRTESSEPPSAPVSVLYRYSVDDDEDSDADKDWQVRIGRMIKWECPLCQLHASFNTRDMLAFHLRCDHDEVKVSWVELVAAQSHSWTLELIIPDPDELESETEDEDEAESEEEDQADVEVEPRVDPGGAVFPSEAPAREAHIIPHPPTQVAADPVITAEPESPVLIPKKLREVSPTPAARGFRAATETRKQTVPTRNAGPSRYPTPPPLSDPLGPAAQFPYLPEASEDSEVYYSCRPGGPRIYDLLNTLSLEPFGVLSWAIVDREEEIFELDDVQDADKVMLALWNRWIMLNRVSFVFDGYAKGIIAFVDQYWEMIHRAAGWGALRAFLLMMVANRFLDVSEVVRILKHYETYTGMDEWYTLDH